MVMKSSISFEEFVSGWTGGIAGLVASHPFDTIKVMQQQGHGATIFQIILRTYKIGGILSFYSGISLPLLMSGIQNAVFFGVYSNVYRQLNEITFMEISETMNIMLSGSAAGCVQVIYTTPVELVKVKLQTATDQTFKAKMSKIYILKGFRGFYCGFIPTALRDVPSGGIYIGTYQICNDILQNYVNIYWSHLLSGGLAGAISYAPMVPFDVVKTRLQGDHMITPKYRGLTDCVVKSYREEGFKCFWKGFVFSTVRSFVNNAFIFVVYELTMDYMINK